PETYTLSLHDALPICMSVVRPSVGPKKLLLAIASVALMCGYGTGFAATPTGNANSLATAPAGISYAALINKFTNHEWDNGSWRKDRKSTRLNSSHVKI